MRTVAQTVSTPIDGAVDGLKRIGFDSLMLYEKVGKRFKAEVMFITSSKVICKVLPKEEAETC